MAQAEQDVACGSGDVSLLLEPAYADLGYSWAESALAACPELVISEASDPESATLIASAEPVTVCEPIAKAPLAIDSAAVVFYLDEAFSLNLSPEVIAGIFDGSITEWTDPAITKLNTEIEFLEQPINVVTDAPASAISAMANWINTDAGLSTSLSLLTPAVDVYWSDVIMNLEPGSIALVPGSEALVNGAVPANIVLANGQTVLLDQGSLFGAASQFAFEQFDNEVIATYDITAEVSAFAGSSDAVEAYRAVYPIYLNMCGEDDLTVRAAARYLVRLDAQGLIATSTLVALPEAIRIASAITLGMGLPQPTALPTEG